VTTRPPNRRARRVPPYLEIGPDEIARAFTHYQKADDQTRRQIRAAVRASSYKTTNADDLANLRTLSLGFDQIDKGNTNE